MALGIIKSTPQTQAPIASAISAASCLYVGSIVFVTSIESPPVEILELRRSSIFVPSGGILLTVYPCCSNINCSTSPSSITSRGER
ncbi:hypothetical protein SAM_1811 [Streptococcus agalactiae CJB111]|nr:hypothetical protein SAM_1811 [Streptococcus agalactiae CJB111]